MPHITHARWGRVLLGFNLQINSSGANNINCMEHQEHILLYYFFKQFSMLCILTGHVTESSGNSGEEPQSEFYRDVALKKTP